MNRLKTITYPGTQTSQVVNEWSKTNRLRSVSNAVATRAYDYDLNDNVKAEHVVVDGRTMTARYDYNSKDQLAAITYPVTGETVATKPDVLGRPQQMSPYVTGVAYWPNGQVSEMRLGNGTLTSYGQDLRRRPNSTRVGPISTGKATIVDMSHPYDFANNVMSMTDVANPEFNRSFGYDGINRLETVNGPWGTGSIAYNGRGDVTRQTFGAFNLTYAYHPTHRKLTSTGGSRPVTYGYDQYGNVTSAGPATYGYDEASNLRCIACGTSSSNDYRYDGTNTRVSIDRAGVRTYEFHDARGNLLLDWVPSQTVSTMYVYVGGKRVAQRRTEDTRAAASVTLAASPNPAFANQPVTFTATVAGGSPAGGTVEVRNGSTVLGSAAVSGTQASVSLQFSAGSQQLTAAFLGNATTKPATSAVLTLNVNPARIATTTVLEASPTAVVANQMLTLTARVSGTNSPSGTVRFSRSASTTGPVALGDVPLAGGVAVLNTTVGQPITQTFTAGYLGTTTHLESSASRSVVVTAAGDYPAIGTILKLRDVTAAVNNPLKLSQLSTTAQATVTYMRAMSGNAHVLGVSVRSGDNYDAVLARLRADATVEYVEPDGWVGLFPIERSAAIDVPGTVTASFTMPSNAPFAPYTYSTWTRVSGTGISVSGTQTAVFSATLASGAAVSSVFTATSRDGVGRVVTYRATVSFSARAAAPLTVTISPSPLTASMPGAGTLTRRATATASGGTAPHSFSWSAVGDTAVSITGATTATPSFSGYVMGDWCYPIVATGTYRVTVTDAAGAVMARDLTVAFSSSSTGIPVPDCGLQLLQQRRGATGAAAKK